MTDRSAAAALRPDAPVLAPGHVWLAGAGPGDPGLLTLDALAGLSQADVVVHDALVDRRVLALAGTQARLEFAGKRGGRPSTHQDDISNRLVELARAGHRVLRLKGGDPCVFGRGGEEALALAAAGIPYRVIPGVTAGLAGLTAAGIPATFRGINRAIILAAGYGADDDGVDWAALARTGQPIVLYMAMRNLATIADELMRGGLPPGTRGSDHRRRDDGRRAYRRLHARAGRSRCATASVGHALDHRGRKYRECPARPAGCPRHGGERAARDDRAGRSSSRLHARERARPRSRSGFSPR